MRLLFVLFLLPLLTSSAWAQPPWGPGGAGTWFVPPPGGWPVPGLADPRYAGRPYYPQGGGYPPQRPPTPWGAPMVVVPMQPPVTHNQSPAEMVYWCDSPRGYYPNVSNCHGPWREISPTQPR